MSNIKIFVAYHKPYPVIKSNMIIPIHLGRSVMNNISKDGTLSNNDKLYLLNNMIGDDTGINISSKNREYCESTGIFWIWKNCLKEICLKHIGYMSYRRIFIFNNSIIDKIKNKDEVAYRGYYVNSNIDNICNYTGLNEDNINYVCQHYDVVLPYPVKLSTFGIQSVLQDYIEKIPGMHINDFLMLSDYLFEINSDLGLKFKNYMYSNTKYMYHCFIVTRKIFEEYCNFLFDILQNIENRIKVDLYSVNGKRTLAYLGEQLYGFYFSNILNHSKIKLLHLPLTFIN